MGGKNSKVHGPAARRKEAWHIVKEILRECHDLGLSADRDELYAFVLPMVDGHRCDRQLIIAKALALLEEASEAA